MTTNSTDTQLTVWEVKSVLDEIAERYPGRADERVRDRLPPRYLRGGIPCCLVAVLLYKLGVSLGQLRELDRETARRHKANETIRISASEHPVLRRFSPKIRGLLDHLQAQQDRGLCWDYIIEHAFRSPPWAAVSVNRRTKPWLY